MFVCLFFNFLKFLMKVFKNCDFNWGGNSCKIYRERRFKGWIYLLDYFVLFVWFFFLLCFVLLVGVVFIIGECIEII